MAPHVNNKKQNTYVQRQKPKINLVFDENARREFLTGFRKRKLQRRNKAKEELEAQLKLEKKRVKAEAKEAYKRLVASQRPVPELEDLWTQELDMDTHSVTVTELSAADLSKKNFIGVNQVTYEDEKIKSTVKKEKKPVPCSDVEGMEITSKRKKNKGRAEGATEDSGHEKPVSTKKDVKTLVRKQATKVMHKSKAFRTERKLQKMRDIKIKKKQEKKAGKKKKVKDKRNMRKRLANNK